MFPAQLFPNQLFPVQLFSSNSTSVVSTYSFSDTLNFTQNLMTIDILTETLSDVLSFTETLSIVTVGIVYSESLSDTLVFSETLNLGGSNVISLYAGPFPDALFPNAIYIYDVYSRTEFVPGSNVYNIVIKDQLNLSDNFGAINPVSNTFEFSDTLTFADYFLERVGSYYYYIHDEIIFIEQLTITQPPQIPVEVSDLIEFNEVLSLGGSIHNVSVGDTLLFFDPYYPKTIKTSINNPIILNVPTLVVARIPYSNNNYYQTLPYVIMQNVATGASITLPGPLFGDEQQNVGTLIINRAISGKIYTVIKNKNRNKLKWKFALKRQLAAKFKQFLEARDLNYLNIIDWKGSYWYTQLTNDPIFTAVSRDSVSCAQYNEYQEVEVEFEGWLLSTQFNSCD